MSKGKRGRIPTAIAVALIGLIGTVLVALIQSGSLRFLSKPTDTPMPTLTFTSTNTSAPTITLSPTATQTPPPSFTPTLVLTLLQGIFPGVDNGVSFLFPDDKSEIMTAKFVESGECVYSPPYGLQLIYGSSGGKGWGIHWNNPPSYHFDASAVGSLRFLVKGALGEERFLIGLKDTEGREIKLLSEDYVLVSATEWREVNIPLEYFASPIIIPNLSFLNNISINFETRHGSGSICLDEFAFVNK